MKEILDDVARWLAAGHRVAVARVVAVDGSGPRDPGATMVVSDAGQVAGSVSGGCVEGAVVEEALAILAGDKPRGVVSFGFSDEEAVAVGLTCGGTIHLYVEPLEETPALTETPAFGALSEALRENRPIALATIVEGPDLGAKLLVEPGRPTVGTLGDPGLDRVVERDALAELGAGLTATHHYGGHGEASAHAVGVFIESFAASPRMIIFGAVDFTTALVRVAKVLGYRVTVCDARAMFATRARFPMADAVVIDWPDRYLATVDALGPRDAVCVLTHDAKFDVPAIVAALRTEAGYVGAMGSRRTHAARVARLREAGVTDTELERVMAPIGLAIGSRTPEETAVAICAEIIALRTGRTDVPSLRDCEGAIH